MTFGTGRLRRPRPAFRAPSRPPRRMDVVPPPRAPTPSLETAPVALDLLNVSVYRCGPARAARARAGDRAGQRAGGRAGQRAGERAGQRAGLRAGLRL